MRLELEAEADHDTEFACLLDRASPADIARCPDCKLETNSIKNRMDAAPAELVRNLESARPLAWYQPGRQIQCGRYAYTLMARPGRDFAAGFAPEVTPAQMLSAGVFEGKYLNDSWGEFPREWFAGALRARRLRAVADPAANAFGLKSRLSLGAWQRNGWIHAPDPRGWFQWYCRYWLGRRVPELDALQIARWRAFARHRGQILASYRRLQAARQPLPATRDAKRAHRARQRQALLQWAYDPWV